jgi:phosphoribosyl 1,2-cyclic phosphodiesterase
MWPDFSFFVKQVEVDSYGSPAVETHFQVGGVTIVYILWKNEEVYIRNMEFVMSKTPEEFELYLKSLEDG